MTKSWVKVAIAALGSAGAALSCSSGTDKLFDTARGGASGAGGGAASANGAGTTSAGMGGTTAGSGSGGSSSGGTGGAARGGAGGVGGATTQGGSAGKTSGAGGDATGGAGTGGAGGKSTTGGSGGSGGSAVTGGNGGAGGKATTGGASGTGGKAATGGASPGGAGGDGGSGGDGVDCARCGANAECVMRANTASCVCLDGFYGDGVNCVRPISCAQLHDLDPSAPTGEYTLKPAAAASEFQSYCEMDAEGGGFTLVLNAGKAFNPTVTGNAKALGYEANGVNLAYSEVLLESDVMLDVSNSAIAGTTYSLRVLINGVHAATRGHTVRALFSGGPYYLEAADNSNLVVRTNGDGNCNQVLENDFAHLVCDSCNGNSNNCTAPVIVFGDVDRCNNETPAFAIGGAQSYVTAWGNCAGWPQAPVLTTIRYFPDNFRVWIR